MGSPPFCDRFPACGNFTQCFMKTLRSESTVLIATYTFIDKILVLSSCEVVLS